MKKHFACFGIICLLFSCESGDIAIDSDRLYSYYELKYDLEKDLTIVKAMMRLDGPEGDLIELTEPAFISFNGDRLLFNPENKEHFTTYSYYVDSGTFNYINSDGNILINSTPKLDDISLPALERISKSKDLVFKWIGDPVGEKEIIQLTLEGSDRAATFQSSELGATQILVPATEIKSLDRFGSGTIKLQRIYSTYMNTGTATGGSMTLKYITNDYVQYGI